MDFRNFYTLINQDMKVMVKFSCFFLAMLLMTTCTLQDQNLPEESVLLKGAVVNQDPDAMPDVKGPVHRVVPGRCGESCRGGEPAARTVCLPAGAYL